ncbi:MAG: hypothetical protein BHW64_01965 [Candidatus Melainabacteria bacterium LEY3_CP_29_8]|nr:MAG: hypothetical protein BHW64_01965 [Candidatus Melainabacteria bacterium LEY3_CP_29_8]
MSEKTIMKLDNEKNDITEVLKFALKSRNNPKDLKAVHVAKVVLLSPLTVSIHEGKTLLEENVELFISEWFRVRCNIDSTGALSSGVLEDLNNAKSIVETHSNGGAACQMPNAISYLSSAIQKINNEFLALKCILNIGDLVLIGSCEQADKYILLDKLLINEEV